MRKHPSAFDPDRGLIQQVRELMGGGRCCNDSFTVKRKGLETSYDFEDLFLVALLVYSSLTDVKDPGLFIWTTWPHLCPALCELKFEVATVGGGFNLWCFMSSTLSPPAPARGQRKTPFRHCG